MTYEEDDIVLVRYPLTMEQKDGNRSAWPWLSGWIARQCGPDEWEVCVETPELAAEHEGETVYPCCFRDSSEIRPATDDATKLPGPTGPGTERPGR